MRTILASMMLAAAAHAEAFRAIDETFTFEVTTVSNVTGEPTDADSVPTYRVYEDETATPILTGSMALLDSANTDGWYSEQITCSAANGFEAGKSYRIRIASVVGGANGATERQLTVSSQLVATTLKTSYLPSATSGASGGLFVAGSNADTTVNFNGTLSGNVGGIAGTINSLDALDTAQDANASTLVGMVNDVIAETDAIDTAIAAIGTLLLDVPTNAEFAARTLTSAAYGTASAQSAILADTAATLTQASTAATQSSAANAIVGSGAYGNQALKTTMDAKASQTSVDDVPTAAENATAILAASLNIGTVQQSLEYLRAAFVSSGVLSEAALAEAPSGGGGGASQPRINEPPAKAYTIAVGSRTDGVLECPQPLRLSPGATNIPFGIDMSPLYGTVRVFDVGEPVVSGGDVTATELGPHDWIAMVQTSGTVTAGERRIITVPVTMRTGETEQVRVKLWGMTEVE